MNVKILRVISATIKNEISNLQADGEKINLKTQIHRSRKQRKE